MKIRRIKTALFEKEETILKSVTFFSRYCFCVCSLKKQFSKKYLLFTNESFIARLPFLNTLDVYASLDLTEQNRGDGFVFTL